MDAVLKTNVQISRVTRHIKGLGLKVAEVKTEATLLCKKRPVNLPWIRVGRENIYIRDSMKYLGVIIDRSWDFRAHLKYIEDKVAKVTRALCKLMPNLRGPGEKKRRLYAMVLTSVVMYAAPVWGRVLATSPDRVLRPLRRLQRTAAIHVVAAYRTVSFDAATLLSRMPPWPLEASLRCRVFERIRELKLSGDFTQSGSDTRSEESMFMIRQ